VKALAGHHGASGEHLPPAGPAAFAAVVEAHWPAVFKLLYGLAGNRHDAEDLTQETFLRAFDRWASFRAGTNLRAWLLRIATNAFLDLRRRRQRAPVQPLAQEPPAAGAAPGRALEVAEEGERLRRALATLTETTRLVFLLRAQEDLSFRDIAELAGTTEQAARWHMHQARVKLLGLLQGPGDGPGGS
jgi:RNA polymerase sigma-70 factor (ECF subfamily)